MSTHLEPSSCDDIESDLLISTQAFPRDYFFTQHVLKPKNVYQPRCLKRKLKKYKLRTDGKEDEEILDISQDFLSSLKIQSPKKGYCIETNNNLDTKELWPKNYLFKMAKRKLKVKPETSSKSIKDNLSLVTESAEKKKTNAFKLLMDSRNKSIGTNSPGKEKIENPNETQEIVEKKTMKVKRKLALQKMAEAKGSLKNKEQDEYEEKLIAKKLEKRAKKLKEMLVSPPPDKVKKVKKHEKVAKNPKNEEKDSEKTSKNCEKKAKNTEKVVDTPEKVLIVDDSEDSKDAIETINSNDKIPNGDCKLPKMLQLINMFDEDKLSKSPKKRIAKEDKEFFKKLSPPIRKKENMLCYFKKIEKETDIENEIDEEPNSPIIKVRITKRSKKKLKHKRLSLKKEAESEVLKDHNENDNESNKIETSLDKQSDTVKSGIDKKPDILKSSTDKKPDNNIVKSGIEKNTDIVKSGTDKKSVSVNGDKDQSKESRRKRKLKEMLQNTSENSEPTADLDKVEEGRPRRNVKRPAKYIDDIHMSSSDEEIFTLKKRKHANKKNNSHNEIVISDEESNSKGKTKEKEIKPTKKPTKLAPIFAPKPLIDPAELEAKQNFLYSGIPEQLRKVIDQQKSTETEYIETFPIVVHVQQNDDTITKPAFKDLPLTIESCDNDIQLENDLENLIGKLVNISKDLNESKRLKNDIDLQEVLKDMKDTHPKFPVYRTYRLLRSKRRGECHETVDAENSIETLNDSTDMRAESPDNLTWTEKYKATSSKHLLGNFDTIKELKAWLTPWTENLSGKKCNGSDSSDFYDSDTNSRDSMRSINNLLVLTGPVGSGKTSSVYAVANELSIKVIEVNASSKRTGKLMLQDLQEATQSHKVNRGTGSAENSQKSQDFEDNFVLKTKKGRPKKSVALLKKSCSNISSENSAGASEETRTALSLILIDDADIIFDQDDGFSAAITQLVQFSKRPVILITTSLSCPHLQRFYSCGNILRMQPFLPRILGSWLDIMCLADAGICWPGLGGQVLDHLRGDVRKTINCLQFFISSQRQTTKSDSQNTELNIEDENSNTSWPDSENRDLLVENTNNANTQEAYTQLIGKELNLLNSQPIDLTNIWWSVPDLMSELYINKPTENRMKSNLNELEVIANLMDTISMSDILIQNDSTNHITSQPWFSPIDDSVSENDNYSSYSRSIEVTNEIVQDLVRSTVLETQRACGSEPRTDVKSPDMAAQRDKDRRISRHDNFTSFLNPSSVLDRKALALDYWSSCRQICRIEKGKFDSSKKRHNRYLHYLKSYNAVAKNDSYNRLGDSLT